MKALVKNSLKAYDASLQNLDTPTPGPGEVVIKVHAAGICGTDTKIYQAHYHKYKTPVVMGHELSGTVVAVGCGVDDIKVGMPVAPRIQVTSCGRCRACITGRDNLCGEKTRIGFEYDGAFAEYIKVRKEQIHVLPADLDLTTASLTEAIAVIVHALRPASIKPSDVVLVVGPGPIGLLAAFFAKTQGATVAISGISQDHNRFILAKELGVDLILVADDEADAGMKELMAITNGEGPDVVLECSGTAAGVNAGLNLCRAAGRFVQIGTRSTPVNVDFMKIAYKEIVVTGTIDHVPVDWQDAIKFIRKYQDKLSPMIKDIYPIDSWKEAFQAAEGGQVGKVIISFPQ
ncbi:MAG: sorbitol dehydrogenase (L-iditol 2-dehydrogenase) [Firmicutes bacterium]|nr:sorbitol dehydrogenase (L-iditol 2-dehydrogenase) [Bacillota bacterium]